MKSARIAFLVTMLAGSGSATDAPVDVARQPWLGIGVRSHRDHSGRQFLHVEQVVVNGPSHRAGIRIGDLIVRVGGFSVDYWDDLDFLMFISRRTPRERLSVRLVRAGAYMDVSVIVGVMPESVRPAWRETVERARKKRLAARLRR